MSWEPFIEPWQFLLTLVREQEMSVLPNRSVSTNIVLKSTTQLNINITESLVEVYKILLSLFMSFSRNLLFYVFLNHLFPVSLGETIEITSSGSLFFVTDHCDRLTM